MKITVINDLQANLELSDREIAILHNILAEVVNYLDHEPEFETRVDVYYAEAQDIITSLCNNQTISSREISLVNNILNEICNGIPIKNFALKIGTSKEEAESYLQAINEVMNELRDR
jgi:hypothetical protein